MTLTARILVVGLSLILFLTVLRMARKGSLEIEYSILWLVLTALGVVAGIVQRQADALSRLVGIDYPPAFFFLLCIVVLLSIVLHLTVRLSRLADQQRDLAQEIALMRAGPTGAERGSEGEGRT